MRCASAVPSQRKRVLEVIRRRLKGVVRGYFIDSLLSIDELGNWRGSLKVRDALSLHDVLDCPPSLRYGEVVVFVLNEGDDAHLSLTLGALERIYLIDAPYARGSTTPTELDSTELAEVSSIVTFLFFRWRRGELGAFAPSPTGVASVVSCDALEGFRDMR